MTWPTGQEARVAEVAPFAVPRIDGDQAALVAAGLQALEACLMAGEKSRIQGRIVALLAHYWAPDMGPELERLVAWDWSDALGRFPLWAVMAAAAGWRDNERRKPTPSDIRQRCQAQVAEIERLARKLRRILERWETDQAATAPASDSGNAAKPYCWLWQDRQEAVRQEVGDKAWRAMLRDLVPVAPTDDSDDAPYQLGAATATIARLVNDQHGETLARVLGRPVKVIVYNFSQVEHAKRLARQQAERQEADARGPTADS